MATAQLGTLLRHIHRLAAGRGEQATDRRLLEDLAIRGDEAAFTALVARHGPMVLRVCRRVLGHEQDAEDAFQATFLVLAQNTRSIHKSEALAGWLHGVAYRTAMKAKRSAARRRNHEARLRTVTPTATAGPTWDEVQAVLDEEIERLPGAYRAAFVLCVLEGKSRQEAAAALGCKEGTVWSRLTRARRRLQKRLADRGIRLAALLAALSVAEGAAGAAVPGALARATVRFGLWVAAGQPAAGTIPSHVAALAAGVTRAMSLTKTRIAVVGLLVAGLVAAAAGLLTRQALAAREKPVASQAPAAGSQRPAPAAAQPAAAEDAGSVAYSGRVLGPDGRPVAGAKLYLTRAHHYLWRPSPAPEAATTGPDGSFRFTVAKANHPTLGAVVTAAAVGHVAGWVEVQGDARRYELTIQLPADDVPITGEIVDLEGKPVAGASLSVLEVRAAPGDNLGPWLEAVAAKIKGRKGQSFELERQYLPRSTSAVSAKVTTDGAGRFRLTGIGRNRLVRAQLTGPALATQQLRILARPGKAFEVTRSEGRPEYNDPRTVTVYYGATFRHVVAPSRPIVGVVRDKDTKKPLAGVSVRSLKLATDATYMLSDGQEIVLATTDSEGRYRLMGMPKGAGNIIKVVPPGDLPYLAVSADVPDSPGFGPVTVDVELKRGVWIEGKITDAVTGKPVKAGVEYIPLYSNPNRRDYPDVYRLPFHFGASRADGSYRVVGLPGPGMIAVYGQKNHYLRVSQREDEFGSKGLSDEEYPEHRRGSNCGALTRVNPARGADKVARDATLDPGWVLKGTVQGPDGKPLAGARSFLLDGHWWDREATKTAEFTAWFNPHEQGEILFQHLEKGLVGVAQPPKENGGSVTVRLGPAAAVTGRLVGADGKPQAGVELEVTFQPKGWGSRFNYLPAPVKTDREGRFRVEGLLPGYEFRLSDTRGELRVGGALRAGQATDLGDVRLKAKEE
jgi:RNA polymerase sigma factor (sigma-70 family)